MSTVLRPAPALVFAALVACGSDDAEPRESPPDGRSWFVEATAWCGLPEEMPLVAPSYSRRKASYARKVGFGRYNRETARRDDETVG